MSEVEVPGNLMFDENEYTQWSVEEVIAWSRTSLNLEENDPLFYNLEEHNIAGDILSDLGLDDCKELCDGDLKKAIRLKLSYNRLTTNDSSSELQESQDNLVVTLDNLYSTVSQKLNDCESQFVNLRTEVLDILKLSNQIGPPKLAKQHHSSTNIDTEQPADGSSHPLMSEGSIRKSDSPNQIDTNIPHSSTASKPLESPSNEPLKQLRASKEDSCERILKSAMKRHNLSDQDWRQYVLVICFGDQERILELQEKPVVIFKNLKQQGLHPAIMLRRRGDFEEMGNTGNTVTPGGRL